MAALQEPPHKRAPQSPAHPYQCKQCSQYFSVKTCTLMQDSNLGLQVWAVELYLMSTSLKGVSSMKLRIDLGITQKTA